MAPHFNTDPDSDGEYEQFVEGSLSAASSLDSLDNWESTPQYSSNIGTIIVDIENPVIMSPLPITSSHEVPRDWVIQQLQTNLQATRLQLFYQSIELDSSRTLISALRTVLRMHWPPTVLAIEYEASITSTSESKLTEDPPEATLSHNK